MNLKNDVFVAQTEGLWPFITLSVGLCGWEGYGLSSRLEGHPWSRGYGPYYT